MRRCVFVLMVFLAFAGHSRRLQFSRWGAAGGFSKGLGSGHLFESTSAHGRSAKGMPSNVAILCRAPPVQMLSSFWKSATGKPSGDWLEALSDAFERLALDSAEKPDLALLFVPRRHEANLYDLVEAAAARCRPQILVGIVGFGVMGNGIELDAGQPGISMLVGKFPKETETTLFTMNANQQPRWSEIFQSQSQASTAIDEPSPLPGFLIFSDPCRLATEALSCLDEAWPNSVVAGCFTSASDGSESIAMYVAGYRPTVLQETSLVGIGIRGPNVEMHSATAPGVAPVGPTYTVTRGDGNVVVELDKMNALLIMRSVMKAKDGDEFFDKAEDCGLKVGVSTRAEGCDDDEEEYVIRAVLGVTKVFNDLVIGGKVTANKTRLRFHVFDQKAAASELSLLFARYNLNRQFSGRFAPAKGQDVPKPMAALCFSSDGQPKSDDLFTRNERPAHDTTTFQSSFGDDVPYAGLFCGGEIGPVGVAGISKEGKQTYVHALATVFALLWDTTPTAF